MKHLRWTGSALLALVMITGGCGPKSAASDQTLTTNIQSQLYADSTTRQANVKVAAKDGVVTLSGDVPSSDVELQAMKIVNGTAGVRSVDDQMKVNGAPGAMAANEPPPAGSAPGNALTGSPASPSDSGKMPQAGASSSGSPVQPAHTTPPPAVAHAGPDETASRAESKPKRVVPSEVTIPAGERLSVRTTDAIDSGKA